MIFGNTRRPIFKAKKAPPRVTRVKVNVTAKNIEAMNQEMEHAVRLDLLNGLRTFKKRIPKRDLDKAFNARGYEGLKHNIPWDSLEGDMGKAAKSLQKVVDKTVEHTIAGINGGEVDPNLLIQANNPALKQKMLDRRKKYLKKLTATHKDRIDRAVRAAMQYGHDSDTVAASVRRGLGLNKQQQIALDNYAAKQMHPDSGLTKAQAKKTIKEREETMIDARAKMIAVTEVRNAANNAQLSTYQAAVDQGIVDPMSLKVWVIGAEDACPNICYPMDGVKVPLDGMWDLPNGDSVSVPSESHPNCRCSFIVETEDDADNDPYDEPWQKPEDSADS